MYTDARQLQLPIYLTWAARVSRICKSRLVSIYSFKRRARPSTYLQLNLSLSNILLASVATGDLLGLSNLRPDGVSAEVLQRVGLGGVDAQDRVGLNACESTGHCSSLVICSLV